MSVIPASFFNLQTQTLGASHIPSVPYNGMRLWDTGQAWKDINTSAGVYNWSNLDQWLAEAKSTGKDVLYTFGLVPFWANGGSSAPNDWGIPPSDIATGNAHFKAFVTAIVNHSLASSTAKINYYELWNEPDLTSFWSGTAAQLVTMAHDAFTIIRALDPSAKIIGPSPSTSNRFGVHFLPAYYAAGGTPYQDYVGCHSYLFDGLNFASTPNQIVDSINSLKSLMSSNGIGGLPIWYTEGSWGHNTTLTSAQQVAYLGQRYLFMWDTGGGQVVRDYWYEWDNSQWGTLWSPASGILPPGTAFRLVQGWLEGANQTGALTQDGNGTYFMPLTLANGQLAEITFNQTTTATITTSTFNGYYTLSNNTLNNIVGGTVSSSNIPIMLVQVLHGVTGNAGASDVTISWTGAATGSVTSNSLGNFSTGEVLVPGTYTFTPSLSGTTFSPTSRSVTISTADISAINFTPSFALHSISGNAGIANATVSWSGPSSGSTVADGSGNYTTNANLADGSYTITPSLTGVTFTPTSQSATVSGANVTNVNFTATVPLSISGNVGLPGVTVAWTGTASGSTTSDGSGSFSTGTILSAGSYTITPSLSGYIFSPSSTPVTITSSNVTGVNFTPTLQLYSVSGNLGIPQGTIFWTGTSSGNVTADSSGNFNTGVVLANGSFVFTPSAPGTSFSPISQNVTVSSANVSNVNFVGAVFSNFISGNVSINGIPLPNVAIAWTGPESDDTLSDGFGNWTTDTVLTPGAYNIVPSLSGYTFKPTSSTQVVTNQSIVGVQFQAVPTVTEGVLPPPVNTIHAQYTGTPALVQSNINVPDNREGSSTVYIPNEGIPITVTPPVGIPQPGSYGTVHGRFDNNTVLNNPA